MWVRVCEGACVVECVVVVGEVCVWGKDVE